MTKFDVSVDFIPLNIAAKDILRTARVNRRKQNEIFIKFELRWKNRSWNGPWQPGLPFLSWSTGIGHEPKVPMLTTVDRCDLGGAGVATQFFYAAGTGQQSHNIGVTWRLKSATTRLFAQSLAQVKYSMSVLCNWSFSYKVTSGFPAQRVSNTEKCPRYDFSWDSERHVTRLA